jgi:hypothetical protein
MPRPLLTAWSFSFLVGCSPCSGRAGQSDMSGCLVWIGWSHLHASCRRGIWFWPCYASQLFVSGCHGLSLPLPLTLLVFKAYSCFERHVATEWPYGLHSVTFVLPGCFAAKSLLLALLLLPSCYMVMIFLDCCWWCRQCFVLCCYLGQLPDWFAADYIVRCWGLINRLLVPACRLLLAGFDIFV